MNAHEQMRIAVVEDDTILREELCHFLQEENFMVFEAMLGSTLDVLLMQERIDLILLDVNLPGESGFEIAERIKSNYPNIGIVMLTARTALSDRIKSYECGADVYLPKPTHPREILAVLKSMHRRISPKASHAAHWVLNAQSRELTFKKKNGVTHLTTTEVHILMALLQSIDYKIDAGDLIEVLSKKIQRPSMSKRALENSVSRLRKKMIALSEDEATHYIDSIWGYGYQLCVPISLT